MDEQTRMARFESMRKMPGRKNFSKNKKLFLKHKELEKMCASEIRRHEFDTKVATVDIKQQQLQVQKKQRQLKAEQDKCVSSREKTQHFLQKQEEKHLQQQKNNNAELKAVRMGDLEKAVKELQMPIHMRIKLMEYVY